MPATVHPTRLRRSPLAAMLGVWARLLVAAIATLAIPAAAHALTLAEPLAAENSPLGLGRNPAPARALAELPQAPESPLESAFAYVQTAVDNAYATRGVSNLVRHGPLNPGPLPAAIANTFRGGSYTANTLTEATTLYRVYGGRAGQLGQYWTRTAPSGPVQSIVDSALLPQWGNTATNVTRIQVPAGTTIYEGFAAAQGGLVGGGSQVVIPSVNPAWIVP